MTGDPVRTNGTLNDRQQQALEFTFAEHLVVKGELEEAYRKLELAEKLIAVNKIEIEGLRVELETSRTRIQSYQIERDEAVAKRAELEGLFSMIMATMREFKVPAVPLIRATENDNADATHRA
jgi:hypothetical protein